jgi:hypothetical protein
MQVYSEENAHFHPRDSLVPLEALVQVIEQPGMLDF